MSISSQIYASDILTFALRGRTSRGIGLEIVRQLSSNPENLIIAACRAPDTATALKEVGDQAKGSVYVVKVDISNETSIKGVAQEAKEILGDKGLDYLINNAAVVRA